MIYMKRGLKLNLHCINVWQPPEDIWSQVLKIYLFKHGGKIKKLRQAEFPSPVKKHAPLTINKE